MRYRLPPLICVLALLAVAGCDRDPTGTTPTPPCVLPALAPGFNAPAVTPADIRPAILDARTRMAGALAESAATSDLRSALSALSLQLTSGGEPACTALRQALDALGRYEAERSGEAATLPDRVMIRIVLNLANAALRP